MPTSKIWLTFSRFWSLFVFCFQLELCWTVWNIMVWNVLSVLSLCLGFTRDEYARVYLIDVFFAIATAILSIFFRAIRHSLILGLSLGLFAVVLFLPVLMLTVRNFLSQRNAPPSPTHATVRFSTPAPPPVPEVAPLAPQPTFSPPSPSPPLPPKTRKTPTPVAPCAITVLFPDLKRVSDHSFKFYLKVYITLNTEPERNTQSFQFQLVS